MATERERTTAVYVISVAAELAGVHPQTLRIYERKGLVEPARTGGGSRRYSDDDIELLRRIQELTTDGMNLVGVQRVLDLEAEVIRTRREVEALKARLRTSQQETRDAVDAAHRSHRRDLVPVRQQVMVWGTNPLSFLAEPSADERGD